MTANERNLPLPMSFRANLLQQVMGALQAGECCSVIGAGGVGKTNLARFLTRPDVQATYWGDEPALVVLIDSNALAHDRLDAFAFLELVMHRLIREVERRGLSDDLVISMDRLHTSLVKEPSSLLAFRYLERLCGRLCQEHGLRVVIIFDQFEDIWRELDPRLFLNLRYLRDEYKYQLVYMTITRERLRHLWQRTRDDAAAVEAFWELFESHVYGLGMYEQADAHTMLERMALRPGVTLDEPLIHAVLTASGGHPALLRSVFWAFYNNGIATDQLAQLAGDASVIQECAKLWEDLLPEEQQAVRRITTGLNLDDPHTSAVLAELRLKELVHGNPPQLFASLFTSYVQRQSGTDLTGVVVDRRARQVWVDGHRLDTALTPLEFSLLEYLANRAGEVCRREDILAALYPDDNLDVNDDRIDALLRRLRDALGDNGRSPRHIVTHRGMGVRLANGRLEG